MLKAVEKELINKFQDKIFFTRKELFDFFLNFEPNLKKGTFGWRIYSLKKKNIMQSLQRGIYFISYKPKFKPKISTELIKFAKKIQKKFYDIEYCIWETKWLNEFSQHQSSKQMIIIEIEKDYVESLYYYLRDVSKYDVYCNPDKKTIHFYISESKYPVIVKRMITRSPIEKNNERQLRLTTPLLEKILVDIFTEKELFYFYQKSEILYIYENAIDLYAINFTTLLSYAKRRDKKQEIQSFMINNMKHLLKGTIND